MLKSLSIPTSRVSLIALLCGAIVSCTSPPVKTEDSLGLSREEHEAILKRNTVKSIKYAGLYQVFQVYTTIETSEMETATLQQKAAFLQWDRAKFQTEREKMLQEHSAYAKFFISFFTPEQDYNDLNKAKTIWKLYLEISGQRFEGKVKKLADRFAELQTLYPFLDKFSTPYEVTFSVPMNTVQNTKCKIILTSSMGSAEFAFPVVQ